MKNRTWALIFAALVLALLAVWHFSPGAQGKEIGIFQDGALVKTVTLPENGDVTTLEFDGAAGGNVVEISKDGVRVASAGCPDQTCVKHGYLTASTGPIVCLPNRLVIRFLEEEGTELDAVSGGRSLP